MLLYSAGHIPLNMSLINIVIYLVEVESEHTMILIKKGFTYFPQVNELAHFASFPEVDCHIENNERAQILKIDRVPVIPHTF